MLPGGVLLTLVARLLPDVTETVYGRAVYPVLGGALGWLSGLLPFSIAEVILVALFLLLICVLTFRIIGRFKAKERGVIRWKAGVAKALAGLGFVYFLFLVLWGLNYHRPTIASQKGIATALAQSPINAEEILALVATLVEQSESRRLIAHGLASGRFVLPHGLPDTISRANEGLIALEGELPQLARVRGEPKLPLLWPVMETFGVAGIYFPFTGEAHLSSAIPPPLLPFLATHELAHQRGVAPEDEANWIAWRACDAHSDPTYRYSGSFAALLYALGALRRADPAAYAYVVAHDPSATASPTADFSPDAPGETGDSTEGEDASAAPPIDLPQISSGLWADLLAVREWQQSRSGPAQRMGRAVNDAYLKLSAQEGVASYGRMVELLVAETRLAR